MSPVKIMAFTDHFEPVSSQLPQVFADWETRVRSKADSSRTSYPRHKICHLRFPFLLSFLFFLISLSHVISFPHALLLPLSLWLLFLSCVHAFPHPLPSVHLSLPSLPFIPPHLLSWPLLHCPVLLTCSCELTLQGQAYISIMHIHSVSELGWESRNPGWQQCVNIIYAKSLWTCTKLIAVQSSSRQIFLGVSHSLFTCKHLQPPTLFMQHTPCFYNLICGKLNKPISLQQAKYIPVTNNRSPMN